MKPKNENDLLWFTLFRSLLCPGKAMQEQQVIIAKLQKQVEATKAEMPMEIGKQ
jgi:hypothetical protein